MSDRETVGLVVPLSSMAAVAQEGEAMAKELHARIKPMHGASAPPDRNVLRDLRAARELLARWLDSEMTDHEIRNIQAETREFLGLKP